MHLTQIIPRLDSLAAKGIVYSIAPGATAEAIQKTETRLGLKLPEQVAALWMAFDGIDIDVPAFKILPLSEWKREGELVAFCICDRTVRIAFDVRAANEAGQWSIINAETGYCITLTMASFWSTRMWSWILKQRPIWHDGNDLTRNQGNAM